MALFPANPTNGETTVVNGITYTYNSAQTAWIRTSTIPPGDLNITGNVVATGNISGSRLVSNVATGTAPLTVSSTTLVTNLNADLLDGYNSAVANTANTVAVRNSDGNLAANFFIGNGSQLTGIITSVSNVSNGNSNLDIPASNGNINLSVAGNSNILVVTGTGANITGTLNVTGNANVGNIGATNGVFTNVSGNGSALTSIAGANVTGAVAFATTANSVAGANVSGQVANAIVAGTVYTAAQPNITSVGTLSNLSVTGNVNAEIVVNGGTGIYLAPGPAGYVNFFTTGGDKATITDTGNIAASNLIANSTVFAVTANISGNVNAGNIGATNGVFTNVSGNGSSLSSITGANVTGAVAFATTANAVAGANVSGQVGNALVAGTVYTAAQPNITSVGTLTSAAVTGNVTAGNVYANSGTIGASIGVLTTGNIATINSGLMQNGNSNVTITANGNVTLYAVGGARVAATSTGANVLGTLGVSGNANVDNLGATQILASANVTAPQLISNVATGTAPFVVTSTTQVANLNAATAGTATSATSATNAAALLQNTSTATTVYPTFSTSGANGNSQAVINNSITANLGNASITATTFVGALSGAATTAGTVTTAAQPNITSVGTLTSLGVSGTVTAPAFTANTGVFTGNGSGLSAIAGANVTGTVSAATTAGTVTTAAQPNITSVGTLSSLAVTANANVGNLNAATRIYGNDNIIIGSTGSEGGQLVLAYTGVNGITGQANSTWNMDVDGSNNFRLFSQNATGVVSAITMAAYSANNNVAFAGNVSAPFFIGNGSQLTGITVSAGNSIVNGNSNVTVTANGNVTTSVAGTANVMVVSSNTVTAPIFAATNNGNGTNFRVGDDAWLGDVNQADTVRLMGQQDAANGYLVFGNSDNSAKLGRAGTGPLTYAGAFTASANITSPQLISNVATGTAPLVVTSTTQVANLNVATSGTVTTAAQPNITSVGTLLGVTSNAANAFVATGNAFNNVALSMLSANASNGANMAIRDFSSVTSTMYFDVGIGGTANGSFQFRTTNSFSTLVTISNAGLTLSTGVFNGNGNSLSSLQGANVTGAVAFATTANAVAGANVSGQVSNALVAGTVYTNAQPNITSVGTLTGLTVGNATANTIFGNGTITATGTANVNRLLVGSGTVGAPGITFSADIAQDTGFYWVSDGNIGFATNGTLRASIADTGFNSVVNVTAPQLISNIATGTAPFVVTSTTQVANLSVATAGTVTTAAQPNITSVGTLTSAAVTGNVTAGNVYSNSGTIGASLLTGTLTTAAQPNITSVGTLTSATVTGNVAAGNLTTTGVLSVTGTGVSSIAGNLDMTSNTIINLATPTNATDAATKQYVDDVAQGLHTHDSCNAATQTTLATISGGTVTYNNGTSGVGATLTTTGSYTTIDGITLSNGMRILVKDEANTAHNGIYDRTSSTVLTRSDDFNTPVEMAGGDFTFVTAGTLYDNTGWVMPDAVTTVGTSPVVWVQFSGAGTYTAGTGLTLTGSQFSVNVAQPTITSVGTLTGLAVNGNITAANITANTGVFTGNGSGLSAIAGANVTGTVSAATTAGTVTTAAQPNITSVSTSFSGLTFVANAQITMSGAGSQISGVNLISANFFSGNGSSITGINASSIASGTLAQARLANSNVILGSTTLALGTTTTTIAGLSSVTSTTFVGALTGAATTAGTVTTAAQPNITSVGTLSSLTVSGNASAGNLNTAGAVVASTLTSNVATGTAPLTVTSTTRVANLNVAQANLADFISVAAGTGNNFLVFANAATGNITELTSTGLIANLSNNSITATTFVGALSGAATSATTAGTVTTAAQPNITSVGTLTSLGVTGNVTAGNANVTGQLISTIATGTAPMVITSTTKVANLNVEQVDGYHADITSTVSNIVVRDANANIYGNNYVGRTFTSNVATGTAPFVVTSNTVVTNLNADLLDGFNTATANTANTVAVRDASGNLAANFFIGNGSQLTGVSATTTFNIANGTSNVSIPVASGNINFSVAGNANMLVVTGSNVQMGSGSGGTISGANLVSANFFTGTLTTAAQPNITSVGTLTSLGVSGTVTAPAFTANTGVFTGNGSGLSAIAGANVTGTVSSATSATSATTAGTVTTAAQPNITSVGTLTVLNVNGTATITTGNITTINSGLVQNGNSNVTITTNGNVTLHAVGGARIIATSTGANVTGTLGVSGNANVLNLGTAQVLATANVIAPQLISNVATGTAPLVVTSTTQVANLNAATAGSAGSATTAGTVTTAAQPNITSVGTLTSLGVTGNITGGNANVTGQLISTVATGTAPLTVTSTTRVANLNVNYANVADFISVAAGTGNNFLIFANAATGNITELTSTGLIANLSNNSITATTFVGALSGAATSATTAGTVTTAAQPNITSTGTLTSLTVSGKTTMTGNNQGVAAASQLYVTGDITAARGTSGVIYLSTGGGDYLYYDSTKYILGSSSTSLTISTDGVVNVRNTTNATSTTTGALIVAGGIGANGNSYMSNMTIKSNVAYVAPNGANTITNQMLNGGTLAWTGNAGQLFSITDSMTGNIFTVNDVSGIPMISVDAGGNIQFAASGGFVSYGVTTGITAAGSTQGTATTLTRPINVISTVSSGANGIILPTVPAGARILIVNTSANALNVYPPSGAVVNSAATNAAYSQPAGARLEYISTSTTQWYTLNATYG